MLIHLITVLRFPDLLLQLTDQQKNNNIDKKSEKKPFQLKKGINILN